MHLLPAAAMGLCLDTGHLAFGGADPVAVCKRYASRVWHVHAKDVRANVLDAARRQELDFPTAVGIGVFAPLGQGNVDFPALLAALRAAGYAGWLVVEQDIRLGLQWPTGGSPLENARTSRVYLERVMGDESSRPHS